LVGSEKKQNQTTASKDPKQDIREIDLVQVRQEN
jgi:hypothetical protein